jgi:hypothetical protein
VTQSDGNRRDNFPDTGGEVGPGQAAVAKIACLDERLPVPGLPLPVGGGDRRWRPWPARRFEPRAGQELVSR